MFIDGVFKVNDVTKANLALIAEKQSKAEEQRISELSELADSILVDALEMSNDGYGIYETLSILGEALFEYLKFDFPMVLSENRQSIETYSSLISAFDKAVFSKFFAERACNFGILVDESEFLPENKGNEIFIYHKNSLSDEAFDVFSENFENAKVKYSASVKESVYSVSMGKTEYCILPLEERGGVRLASIAEYIFKEDLKIASVTPVFGLDGSSDMKYALISKHFMIPEIKPDDDRYFEIRLVANNSAQLSEIFAVAQILGIGVYRMNTMNFDTDYGERLYYSLVFKSEGQDFSALLVYLTLFAGEYTAVGLYKNLE